MDGVLAQLDAERRLGLGDGALGRHVVVVRRRVDDLKPWLGEPRPDGIDVGLRRREALAELRRREVLPVAARSPDRTRRARAPRRRRVAPARGRRGSRRRRSGRVAPLKLAALAHAGRCPPSSPCEAAPAGEAASAANAMTASAATHLRYLLTETPLLFGEPRGPRSADAGWLGPRAIARPVRRGHAADGADGRQGRGAWPHRPGQSLAVLLRTSPSTRGRGKGQELPRCRGGQRTPQHHRGAAGYGGGKDSNLRRHSHSVYSRARLTAPEPRRAVSECSDHAAIIFFFF